MPIKIPDGLPAFDALVCEGVRVMTEAAAIRQDIRPLQIGLLNLMPNKIRTELQIARLLGASPLQVELTLVRLGNHRTKHASEDHMMTFYKAWEDAKHRKFDGLIVTGTPLETIPYEEVRYWDEMRQIFDWTGANVHSTMLLCWGAMAALYHFYGVPKQALPEKAFGVFKQTVVRSASAFLSGFSDEVVIPVSRWAKVGIEDVQAHRELSLLCYSEKGVSIVEEGGGKRLYVFDHLEYDAESLADEYFRDLKANVPIKLPVGYFPDDDPTRRPLNRWRAHGYLLMSNWINEMYQTAPYEIDKIGEG